MGSFGMKSFLCMIILATAFWHGDRTLVAFKSPAAARDLGTFYRSIQALSADSFLNESAIAIV